MALARKLLVALWRYVTQGVVPEGAVLEAASPGNSPHSTTPTMA